MLVIRAGISQKLVRKANREDPDMTASSERLLLQKQSDLGLQNLSRPFWQVTSVGNFRRFTISSVHKLTSFVSTLPYSR